MSAPKITGQAKVDMVRLIEIENEIKSLVAEAKTIVLWDEFEHLKNYWAALIMVS